MDSRLEWFKNCLLIYFGENDDVPFETFLERNNGQVASFLNSFLNDRIEGEANLRERSIFVYKTYYSKMIEEEIEIQERVSKSRSASLIASSMPMDDLYRRKRDKRGKKKKGRKKSDVKETTGDEIGSHDEKDDDEDDSDTAADSKKQKNKQQQHKKRPRKSDLDGGGRLSPYTMMQNINYDNQAESDVSYVTVKKTVQKVIEVPQFQCFFGIFEISNRIKEEKADIHRHYVYFVRRSNLPIPVFSSVEESYRQMPSYFLVGSLSENLLNDFALLMTLVFKPLFVTTTTFNEETDHRLSTADENEKNNQFENDNVLNEFLNYQRPSYYYRLKHIAIADNCCSISGVTKNPSGADVFADYKALISNSNNLFNVPNFHQLRLVLNSNVTKLTDTVIRIQAEIERENNFVTSADMTFADLPSEQQDEESLERPDDNGETIVRSWIDRMAEILSSSANSYEKAENNLLYEYEYWMRVKTQLDRVVDDLSVEKVRKLLNILREKNCQVYEMYRVQYDLLINSNLLAAENVTVLHMLKDYFKDLILADFDLLTVRLPRLIGILQNVWILSKHYSLTENMMRMLERIKWTLCWRTRTVFDVENVFKKYRYSPTVLEKLIREATSMLNTWKTCYLSAKEELDNFHGSFVQPWEFKTDELFFETDYIVVVLDDITVLVEFLIEYEIMANCKLKMIINEDDLDEVNTKITNALALIEKADFDVYAEIFKEEKQEILDEIDSRTKIICDDIKKLLLQKFSNLKNVELGIEILQDLVSNKWQFVLSEEVFLLLFKEVSSLYRGRISESESTFNNENGDKKSVESINWSRSLLEHLERAETKIRTFVVENYTALFTFAEGQETLAKFADFKREINQFESSVFKQWCCETENLFKTVLKLNLMKIVPAEDSLDLSAISFNPEIDSDQDESSDVKFKTAAKLFKQKDIAKIAFGGLVATAKWATKSHFLELKKEKLKKTLESAHTIPWHKFVSDSLLIEKGYTFSVNVDDKLFEKFAEAAELSKMGLKLPPDVKVVLLMAASFKENYGKICDIVEKYSRIMSSISPAQVLFMKRHLRDVELAMQPAVTRYTWCSLSIDYFVGASTRKLTEFAYLLTYVQNTIRSLDENVIFVGKTRLFFDENLLSNFFGSPVSYDVFFDKTDEYQMKKIRDIARTYERLVSTLVQMEFIILGTNSSSSKCMFYYYDKYEYDILNVLTKTVTRSLIDLKELLNGKYEAKFFMKVSLYKENPTIHPNAFELFDRIKLLLKTMFHRLKPLRHWRKNSCIPMGDEESTNALHYDNLINDANINNQAKLVMSSTQNLCSNLTSITAKWTKYRKIWKRNKETALYKFVVGKNPNLSEYELKFDFYSDITDELETITGDINSGCVRICQKEIIDQLKHHCAEWKEKLGVQLILNTRRVFCRVKDRIHHLSDVLVVKVTDEHALIKVLQSVEDVQNFSYDVERCFQQIREQHHELSLQNLTIPAEDIAEISALKCLWDRVGDKALYRKVSLCGLKEKLRSKMETKQNQFLELCNQLVRNFYEDYPIKQQRDYDECVKSMQVFSAKFDEINSKKLEIEKIQRLFDLYPVDYSVLDESYNDLCGLRQRFKQC